MNKHLLTSSVAAAAMLLLAVSGQAQQTSSSYAAMAPIESYLMPDPAAEIALARSAAPPALANEASVLVLSKDGYHTAIEGKNGFTCVVERSWMSPIDSPEFWNFHMRGPVCYNPPAVRSILPYTILRTRLLLNGSTKAQMVASIQADVAANKLPMPEPGAMSFMLSKNGYLGDEVTHWHPHLMFHLPRSAASSWGANLEGSPVVVNTAFTEGPEPETIFMVPTDTWSDGTPAASGAKHEH